MTQEELINATYSGVIHALNHLGVSQVLNSRQLEARQQAELQHANPLVRCSAKCYSQNGEDGIILEMIRRLALGHPLNFVEFGVGNGLENNTVNLLFHGHRGAWVGGEDLAFALPKGGQRLHYTKTWITAENAVELYRQSCDKLGVDQADLFSLDLDGVDLYILEALLNSGQRPAIVICEYNGKFPPPVEFCIAYDPQHQWDGSDYFGASLASFNRSLSEAGYRLVGCDISGVNAFWVHERFAAAFSDVPSRIEDLYVAANYGYLYRVGHSPSAKTIERFLA